MNIILRKLTNECYNSDTNLFFRKIGNYCIKRDKYGTIYHYYYKHLICIAWEFDKEFVLDACGYLNYRLITSQLNFLEEFYKNKGYKLVERK